MIDGVQDWSVAYGDQPDSTKWDILGTNDAALDNAIGTGWIPFPGTFTYASADSPTFTFTISGDYSGVLSPGMRIKLTQTTIKYFIITAVSFSSPNTTVTVYGGTDYTLANATITSPCYSNFKAPFGFPLNPVKWTVSFTDVTQRSQATPTAATWYNLGSVSFAFPIGSWNISYRTYLQSMRSAAAEVSIDTTLSSSSSSETNNELTVSSLSVAVTSLQLSAAVASKPLNLTTKTNFYINSRTQSTGITNIYNRNEYYPLIINLVSAYL